MLSLDEKGISLYSISFWTEQEAHPTLKVLPWTVSTFQTTERYLSGFLCCKLSLSLSLEFFEQLLFHDALGFLHPSENFSLNFILPFLQFFLYPFCHQFFYSSCCFFLDEFFFYFLLPNFSLPLELRFLLLLLPLLLLVQAAALAHRAPEDVDAVGRGRRALPVPLAPGHGRVGGARARARLPPPVPFTFPGFGALPHALLVPRPRPRPAPLLVVFAALGVFGAGRAAAPRPAHPSGRRCDQPLVSGPARARLPSPSPPDSGWSSCGDRGEGSC